MKKSKLFKEVDDNKNIFKREVLQVEEEKEYERIDGKKIPPGTVRNHHMEFGLYAVQVSEERPTEGNEYRFHFNPTTGVLSAWSGSAWLTTTLT